LAEERQAGVLGDAESVVAQFGVHGGA